jgi:hypothetical protein
MLMKVAGLITLLVVVAFAIDAVAGPFFSLSTQSWGPERRGDKLMGIAEGHLKSTDVATRTVRITSGFLGLDSLSLQVTPDTMIGVNGKLGGFGDLDRGQLVRVAYEVASNRRVASRVEVLHTGSTTALTATPSWALSEDTPADRPASDAGVTTSPAIEPVAAAPIAVPTAAVSTPAEAPAPTAFVPTSTETPALSAAPAEAPAPSLPPAPRKTDADGARPARLGETATRAPRASAESARRPEVRSAPAASPRPSAPSSAPAVSGARTRTAPDVAPVRREAEDAGAVIDWLLNSSPARGQ